MAFQRVASAQDLPAGAMLEVARGERAVAVCNVEGTLHAIDGRCPHQGGWLAQGALHGKMIVCPWHAWEFDCTTGQNDADPEVRQKQFAVKMEAGEILLDWDR